MKRLFAALLIAALAAAGLSAADNVTGLWKIIDDKTQKPNAIAMLYLYQGKLYGRLLVTISTDTGKVDGSYLAPGARSKNLVGEPAIAGLDFVYNLEDKGKEWVGQIIDPKPGDEYDCVIKKQGANLDVRGQLKGLFGFLGRNQKWVPAAESDLPPDTPMPDAASLVPVIPKKK